MSRLPSFGGIFSGIAEGAATVVGQIAQFFRIGRFGSVEPPVQPEPARPRLTTPEQIIEQAVARHLLPAPDPRPLVTVDFLCIVTDPDSGRSVPIRHSVEYYEGELSRSGAYSRARRYAAKKAANYFDESQMPNLEYKCYTMGSFTFTNPPT